MGHRPSWLSYQLSSLKVLKERENSNHQNEQIFKFEHLFNKKGTQSTMTSYSYNWPQFLIRSRFTYPNDLPMTSQWPQTAFARLLLICSLILDLSSTGLIKKRGTQCFKSRKREPYPYQAQMAEFEVTSFLIRLLELWSRMR